MHSSIWEYHKSINPPSKKYKQQEEEAEFEAKVIKNENPHSSLDTNASSLPLSHNQITGSKYNTIQSHNQILKMSTRLVSIRIRRSFHQPPVPHHLGRSYSDLPLACKTSQSIFASQPALSKAKPRMYTNASSVCPVNSPCDLCPGVVQSMHTRRQEELQHLLRRHLTNSWIFACLPPVQ